jgi:hypothetical protein
MCVWQRYLVVLAALLGLRVCASTIKQRTIFSEEELDAANEYVARLEVAELKTP